MAYWSWLCTWRVVRVSFRALSGRLGVVRVCRTYKAVSSFVKLALTYHDQRESSSERLFSLCYFLLYRGDVRPAGKQKHSNEPSCLSLSVSCGILKRFLSKNLGGILMSHRI